MLFMPFVVWFDRALRILNKSDDWLMWKFGVSKRTLQRWKASDAEPHSKMRGIVYSVLLREMSPEQILEYLEN